MKKIFLMACLIFACFFCFLPVLAYIQVIPQNDPWENVGKAMGDGFADGFNQARKQAARQRQAEEQLISDYQRNRSAEIQRIAALPENPTLAVDKTWKIKSMDGASISL